MDVGFNALVAIQSSAFLMTLFRKGLVRWYTHAIWYSLALLAGTLFMVNNLPIHFFAKVVISYNIRCNLGIGKYYMWSFYVFMSLPCVENAFFGAIQEYKSNMTSPDFSYFANPVSI